MNVDIRVSVSFKNHRKRRKLQSLLGADAVLCLLDLWIGVAMSNADGVLTAWDEHDIALEAGWNGEPEEFVKVLRDCRFLDVLDDGTYKLHDWEDHQRYVIFSEKRKERARMAAASRWDKKNGLKQEVNANSIDQACYPHAGSNAPYTLSPIPSPTNIDKPKGLLSGKTPDSAPDQPLSKQDKVPITEIINHLNAVAGTAFKPTTRDTRGHIKARWQEGHRLPDFLAVIDFKSDEWLGDAKMQQFVRPQTLFGTKFESYLQAAKAAGHGATQQKRGWVK